MKRLLLISILMAMAILAQPAFGQLDSCNMTLLDEWEIPGLEHTEISPAPFCFLDSFIFVSNFDSTHVLKIDSLDQLLEVTTLPIKSHQIFSRDSILFSIHNRNLTIYNYSGIDDIDSIGACLGGSQFAPYLADTFLFSLSSRLGRTNISNYCSPFYDCIANEYACSPNYGPFFDGRFLYICGSKEFGEIYDYYTKSVLEVYDPYSFADSIAFKGRYLFGDDIIGHLSKSRFVEFIQDSFMIFGNSPNIFSTWIANEERDSFELFSTELDSNFSAHVIQMSGDSLMFIAGMSKVNVYNISDFPEYSLIGYYQLLEPTIFSLAVNLPYILVHYRDDTPTSNLVQIKLIKYTPSDGLNCSYNAKEENDFHIFPNPFNSSCSIEFASNTQSIEITDIRGNTVKSIENPTSFNWQPQNLPSGLYFITVDFGETKITKKTVYLR